MSVHLPVPNVARFHVRADLFGIPVETCHCFRKLSPPITQASLDLEAGRIKGAWDFAMLGQLSSDIVWREVFAEDLTPGSTLTSTATPFFSSSFQGPGHPGSIAISLMPLGPTLPRQWQWRVRVFGVPLSKVSGNLIDTAWADAFKTLVRDRYTLQGAFGWRPVVVQQVLSGAPLSVGVPYDVTDYSVPTYVVSPMRRRLR